MDEDMTNDIMRCRGEYGRKIRSGDCVGLYCSNEGNNEECYGKMLHNNMEEGGPISVGGTDDGSEWERNLAWRLYRFKQRCWGTDECDYVDDGKKIKTGDRVMLVGSNDMCLHSNTADGGMASCAPCQRCDMSFIIWGDNAGEEGIKITNDMRIQFECVAQPGVFFHSNASDGGPYSMGGENAEQGWNLRNYGPWDCGYEGNRISSGMCVSLCPNEAGNNPDNFGLMLHSNMDDGAMVSMGGRDGCSEWEQNLAWRMESFKKSARGTDSDNCRKHGKKIKTGDWIMLCGNANGLALHSNTQDGGGASASEVVRADQGFIIWGEAAGEEGIRVHEGMVVQFECVAQPGVFMHSNCPNEGGFSMGGENPENGWTLACTDPFSSSSSSDWEAWDN
jgi:hypothetical protein